MFGASAVRKKRERERREKEARGSEPIIFPYIKVAEFNLFPPYAIGGNEGDWWLRDSHIPFINDNLATTKPFGVRFDREELPYFKQRRLEETGGRNQFLHHWEVGLRWIDLDTTTEKQLGNLLGDEIR